MVCMDLMVAARIPTRTVLAVAVEGYEEEGERDQHRHQVARACLFDEG